ncbi:secretin N-terminal domain-containing protein [Candidatus Palauibacter sp.]|uniref:secretin N-terminal domain-containing protein n=1 Tax=Candidatus Palauibacter sp. TaxID=3101350 RepID=UPI003C6EF326
MICGRIVSTLGMALAAGLGQETEVREVRIATAGTDTEITVVVGGEVTARHLMIQDPPRLILDLEGAVLGLGRDRYEGIGRGGVIRMRSSQFQPDIVRIVFDLALDLDHEVVTDPGAVRVTFPNRGPPFPPWSTAAETTEAETTEAETTAAETTEARAGPGEPSRTLAAVRQEEPRISVVYDSASMLDVLAGFSEFADISVVPNGEIASVTVRGIDIRAQPWDIALNAILSAHNLGWHTTESGIIVVDWLENLQARDQLLSETRVIRINYARADSVAEALRHLATPNRGQVVAFSGSNTVIVTDAPSVVARMDTIIASLDRRLPQVAIEAKIVFVNRTDVQQLGIVYDLKERDGAFVEQGLNELIAAPDPNEPPQLVDHDGDGVSDESFFRQTNETLVNLSGDAIAALANANDRPLLPALQILTSVAFGEFSLFAFLEALESHQLSDVQAAPSIQVVDNAHARIQVGERTPIRVLEAGAQTEAARVNVQFEDTGIILDVIPHVTNNNQIRLELMAERSGLKLGLSDVGFVFEKQIGETTLLLEDGETAVIGGLTLSEVSRSESGIPGLMHLPWIGALFRSTKENEVKQDLIILVTPHIIGGPRGG